MTAFPASSDFADNIAAPKDKQRALIDAILERIGTLPADYSGFASRFVFVKLDESGLYLVQSTDTVDGDAAIFTNMSFKHGTFEKTDYTPSSNAVALDHENGTVHLVSLTANISANGFTLANLPAKPAFHIVRISQDGSGGRTIDGGSTVNAGFSSTDFDFGGITINVPSGANDFVVVGIYYWGSGKSDVRELLTRT